MRNVVRTHAQAGLISVTALLLVTGSACSLASRDDSRLSITVPDHLGSSEFSISSSSSTLSSVPAPTTLNSFNCFAVNVSGPGIAPNPNLNCPNFTDTVAIVGGLIPATGGSIELNVPSGPGRRVQLIGIQSVDGSCPDINQILEVNKARAMNPSLPDPFEGLGDPYQLGEAHTDVFGDTSVTIVAQFDPNHPKILFQGCEEPGTVTVPLTSGVKAVLNGAMAPSGTQIAVPGPSPSPTPLASETPLTPTELSLITTMENELSPGVLPSPTPSPSSGMNSVVHRVAGDGTPTGSRAVIRLKWDVTSIDLSRYQVVQADVQATGGSDCPSYDGAAQSGLLAFDMNSWASANTAASGPLSWSTIDRAMSFPALPWVVNDSGNKYFVLDVESTMLNTNASCGSYVAVGGARLKLREVPEPLQIVVNASSLANLQSTGYYLRGGMPPYSTVAATCGTLDTNAQTITAPSSSSGTCVLSVTDAHGVTATTPITYHP